jgi:hypothetical protein
MADEGEHDSTVIPNAKLTGTLSGAQRQIDVLIDSRLQHDATRRVIVDAKRHKRPIDIKQVEEFEGMMRDVQAHRGILVCPNGYTNAALRRAQDAITIRLVPLSDLESLDLSSWDPCSHPACDGLVLWDATPALSIGGRWAIFATSKCDECRRFNVWCWDCWERFALDDEDEHRCSCKGPWFWLTAIEDESEDDTEQLNAVYLLLVYGLGQHAVVDRRPLR